MRTLLLVVCGLIACGDEAAGGEASGGEEMAGMTEAHNVVRRGVKVPDLAWSSAAADTAQKHANKCVFQHSGNRAYGENLFASFGSNDTPAAVVQDWASEAADYNYTTNTCASGKVCGHYTQVVWAKTTHVGCAMTTCTSNSPFSQSGPWSLWVCDYEPPGNVVGQKPY